MLLFKRTPIFENFGTQSIRIQQSQTVRPSLKIYLVAITRPTHQKNHLHTIFWVGKLYNPQTKSFANHSGAYQPL